MASRKTSPAAHAAETSENAHVAVGREIAEEGGVRATTVWELLKNPERAADEDMDFINDPYEIGVFLQDQMDLDVDEEPIDTFRTKSDHDAYEHYVELWKQHGPDKWPVAALTCYLMLEGIPFPEKKAEALWLHARANYLEHQHTELVEAREKEVAEV